MNMMSNADHKSENYYLICHKTEAHATASKESQNPENALHPDQDSPGSKCMPGRGLRPASLDHHQGG
jgi:hypothetical protein